MTELERTAKRALKHFGPLHQESKAIEELGELIVALSRVNYRGNADAVVEEIADCYLMLEQLRLIYDSEKINAMIGFKLARLNQRIEAGHE